MRASVVTRALAIEGVDLVMWLERDAHEAPREAVLASPGRGELRFAPGGQAQDPRGRRWSVDGPARGARRARRRTGVLLTPDYPDALARVWSALTCPTSGEVLLSAAPGYEFIDWGRQAHVGGGSHGSLHASDSLGALLISGAGAARARARRSGRSATSRRSCWRTSACAAVRRRRVSHRGTYTRETPARRQCSAPLLALRRSPAGDRNAGCAADGHTAGSHGHAADAQRPRSRPATADSPGRTLDHAAGGPLAVAEPGAGDRAKLPMPRPREYPGSYGGAYLKGPLPLAGELLLARTARRRSARSIIDDLTGRVLEQWTGFQVAWTMARGYPGAFGGHVNALYIWLPLCLLFLLPFFNFRRPFSLLHLDLLVLLSFSVSLAFFNHAHIYGSVPLAYPPLLYLLARMLALLRRRAQRRQARRDRCACSSRRPGWRSAVVFLIGFRVGAQRHRLERHRRRLRGRDRRRADRRRQAAVRRLSRPTTNTATPTARSTTRPTCPSSRSSAGAARWDDLPAAHAAAIFFDLLSVGAAVPDRPAHARPDARHRPRLRVGLLPVHAVRAGEQQQRHARRGARAGGAAGRQLPLDAGARRPAGALRRARRPDEVRPARARAAAGDRRAARAARARRDRLAGAVRGGLPGARRAGRASRRSRTTRCTRSTSARSTTRPTAARRSRSGACTAGTARAARRRGRSPSRSRSCSRSSRAAATWSGWPRAARRS